MHLPDPIASSLQPLFDALPLEQAMSTLCPSVGADAARRDLVESILKSAPFDANPPLQAGLWLYVDELDRSHTISQNINDATGSYWHGIMHRREGDFSNSHYWFKRVGKHPAMALLDGYDGHALVDAAESVYPADVEDVVRQQRQEWANLFAWCANRPA